MKGIRVFLPQRSSSRGGSCLYFLSQIIFRVKGVFILSFGDKCAQHFVNAKFHKMVFRGRGGYLPLSKYVCYGLPLVD